MIAHEQKAIFIHIPKCAGQSIENAFLRLNGLDRNTRLPLLLQPNNDPNIGPPQLAHLLAKEYVQYHYISQELFFKYFKFAFVRNPWSRLVSFYNYSSYRTIYTFSQFLHNYFIPKMWIEKFYFVRPQVDYLFSDDGKLLVDYIGKFESLDHDFSVVCENLNISKVGLEHANKSDHGVGKDKIYKRWVKYVLWSAYGSKLPIFKNYRDYYDSKSKKTIEKYYLADIEYLKYEF